MEFKRTIILRKVENKFKNNVSVKYTLSLQVNQFCTIDTVIDESKYILALMQKGKNPLTTNELKLNVPVEFYTGLGANNRPYYMALVPYATYKDKDGNTHARKQSLFFSSAQQQLAVESPVDPIEFEEKEFDSITEDEIETFIPEEEKK